MTHKCTILHKGMMDLHKDMILRKGTMGPGQKTGLYREGMTASQAAQRTRSQALHSKLLHKWALDGRNCLCRASSPRLCLLSTQRTATLPLLSQSVMIHVPWGKQIRPTVSWHTWKQRQGACSATTQARSLRSRACRITALNSLTQPHTASHSLTQLRCCSPP